MRLAVFSDVHGNLTALDAVLSAIARETVDEIVFAGDLCLVGPRPSDCVDRLRSIDCTAVYGNTDDWLLGRQPPPPHLADIAGWTHDQLDHDQRDWLSALPFAHTVSPTGSSSDDLLIVHANPVDVNQLIFPPEEDQLERFGHLRQPDSELAPLLQDTTAPIIAFGHLHVPFIRLWEQVQLINISSVSMPGDGDVRAKYGLFTWHGTGWSFERKYVAFDPISELTAYRAKKPPGWQNFVETMIAQRAVPQNV